MARQKGSSRLLLLLLLTFPSTEWVYHDLYTGKAVLFFEDLNVIYLTFCDSLHVQNNCCTTMWSSKNMVLVEWFPP